MMEFYFTVKTGCWLGLSWGHGRGHTRAHMHAHTHTLQDSSRVTALWHSYNNFSPV